MNVKELREKLGRLVHESRVLLDLQDTENRAPTAEEEEQYQRIEIGIVETEKAIEDAERREKLEAREEYLAGREREPVARGIDPNEVPRGRSFEEDDDLAPFKTDEYRSAFAKYLRGGDAVLDQFERRALSQGTDTEGGYTVPQEQFVRELIKELDELMPFRALSRGFTLTQAKSLGAPALDADPADPVWTGELLTGDEDSSMDFNKRELSPHPVAKRIKVSNKLIRNSALSIEQIVRERMAYKLYSVLENAYMTGTGSQQPLGVFTASADGISTARDVDVGDTSGGITLFTSADKFMTARHTLKVPYWSKARWLFHRTILSALRKLKDTNSTNYLWQPGLAQGAPPTFLDLPYSVSEFAPGTIGAGNYVALLGDFSYYWRADALNIALQRLVELYAETNQTGYIIRGEFDAMPVLEEAFVRCVVTA